MEFFETACTQADSTVTKIRVYVTRHGRRTAERLTGDADKWLERCVWRFLAQQHKADLVHGDSVEFTMDGEAIKKLIADLREIDLEKAPRRGKRHGEREI